MHRPRLRVRESCRSCRKLRKKCDGKRPQCGPCTQREFPCVWSKASDPGFLDSTVSSICPHDIQSGVPVSPYCTSDSSERLRGPSATPSTAEPEFRYQTVECGVAEGQNTLASTTDFGNKFDEHVIILGVARGWESVTSRFLLDRQWLHLVMLDDELARLKFTIVTRWAVLWYARMKMKFMASYAWSAVSRTPLPLWAVKNLTHHIDLPTLVNYPPWPALRRLIASSPERFCNATWSNNYMRRGAGFAWPFGVSAACTSASNDQMFQFTPEFMLRVTNLRSWTFGKDFLDANSELRGVAPQLEPSPTNGSVSARSHLEHLYWHLLRQKHAELSQRNKNKGARTMSLPSSCLLADH